MYLSYLQMELKHDLYNIDNSQKTQASILLYHLAYLASSDGFNMLSGPWLPIKHRTVTISQIYILYIRFI